MRIATLVLTLLLLATAPATAQLYVGIETGSPVPMHHSDLAGFPNVTWTSFHTIDVSGAAARPDGTIYVCNGSFTTELFEIAPGSGPSKLCTIDKDMTALAFGRGKLYGYSNYATPKGIYEIDPTTGVTTLAMDVYTGTSFRFFGLGYNPVDDLFYGYTEYGSSGLYEINIDTKVMTKLVGTIPASNGQGRGLAVGNNTVYLTATRGDAGIPFYAYDLAQGAGGTWVGFDNAYPNHHSTGGAAWVPEPDPLTADTTSLSQAVGGIVTLSLDAGPSYAGRIYLLVGCVSGTQPGTPLPGGLVIPLNRDFFTDFTLLYANGPRFAGFQGTLNSTGQTTAFFNTLGPLPPGSVGRTVHFAGTLFNPFDFVTNAVAIDVVP